MCIQNTLFFQSGEAALHGEFRAPNEILHLDIGYSIFGSYPPSSICHRASFFLICHPASCLFVFATDDGPLTTDSFFSAIEHRSLIRPTANIIFLPWTLDIPCWIFMFTAFSLFFYPLSSILYPASVFFIPHRLFIQHRLYDLSAIRHLTSNIFFYLDSPKCLCFFMRRSRATWRISGSYRNSPLTKDYL